MVGATILKVLKFGVNKTPDFFKKYLTFAFKCVIIKTEKKEREKKKMFVAIDGITSVNTQHIMTVEKFKKVAENNPYCVKITLSNGTEVVKRFPDSGNGRAECFELFEKLTKNP